MTKAQQSERDEFIAKLRETLKPGDTLHTVVRSVSRTGMSRVIDVYRFYTDDKGTVRKDWLSYWIAKACGFTFQDQRGKPEGIKIGGCGMDMGFHLVYEASRVLFPDGFGVKCDSCGFRFATAEEAKSKAAKFQQARSKGHQHAFVGRNGDRSGWDNDGGYALNQEWL